MYRVPIVMERKLELKSTVWTRRKNIQPEKNEETRIQKMRRGLGTSRTTLNIPTSEGVPGGEKKRKKLKNYLKK